MEGDGKRFSRLRKSLGLMRPKCRLTGPVLTVLAAALLSGGCHTSSGGEATATPAQMALMHELGVCLDVQGGKTVPADVVLACLNKDVAVLVGISRNDLLGGLGDPRSQDPVHAYYYFYPPCKLGGPGPPATLHFLFSPAAVVIGSSWEHPKAWNGPASCIPSYAGEMFKNPWLVEFIGMMGKWTRKYGYPTKEACEAAILTLPKGDGGDGHCVYHDWKNGLIIGSQDPAWAWAGEKRAGELSPANHANPSTQKYHWAAEFIRADGKYERTVMFLSKEDCEAGLAKAMNKTQSPPASQGHCIRVQ